MKLKSITARNENLAGVFIVFIVPRRFISSSFFMPCVPRLNISSLSFFVVFKCVVRVVMRDEKKE